MKLIFCGNIVTSDIVFFYIQINERFLLNSVNVITSYFSKESLLEFWIHISSSASSVVVDLNTLLKHGSNICSMNRAF